MGFQFCHSETISKISLGHCGPLTPTLQFRHLPLQSRQVCRVTFFNCISDGAVNHISPAQFLAYLQQAAMTFSLLLLSQASKDVSYTKPNHWFLRISFDICESSFFSTLLHQTKAPNRNRRGVQAKKHLCYSLRASNTKPNQSTVKRLLRAGEAD